MDKKKDSLNHNIGFIYFMTERDLFGYPCGPYVKIGLVKGNDEGRSSFDRRKEHQTGNPREIIIEAEVETHAQVSTLESLVHQRLAKYRIHGEWFNYGEDAIQPYVELTKKINKDLEEQIEDNALIKQYALIEDNVNGTEYEGFRSSIGQEIGENWNATLVYAEQTIESDGVFFADPNLGDLEIQRYSDDHISDEYENMSLTLEGSLGELEAVYAGAYTDRETNQIVDYTDYLFVGQYLPYYICDYYVTYTTYAPGGVPTGSCGTSDLFVDSTTNTKVESHEFRVNAPINDKMSITAGVFMSDTELTELNLFTYPGSLANDIGKDLSCGAYLHALSRVSVGEYKLEDALSIENIKDFL